MFLLCLNVAIAGPLPYGPLAPIATATWSEEMGPLDNWVVIHLAILPVHDAQAVRGPMANIVRPLNFGSILCLRALTSGWETVHTMVGEESRVSWTTIKGPGARTRGCGDTIGWVGEGGFHGRGSGEQGNAWTPLGGRTTAPIVHVWARATGRRDGLRELTNL